MALIRNPMCTTNGVINITSGTGAINIATDAAQKTLTLGNDTGASAVVVTAGTGGFNSTSTGAILMDAAAAVEINSSAGAISIGNDAVAQAVNIGTGAAARTVTIGNNTGASAVVLNVGSAGLSVPSFVATGALVSNAAGLLSNAAGANAGQVLTANGVGVVPSFQDLPAGGMTWNNVENSTPVVGAVLNGYVANSAAGAASIGLPATAAVGSIICVQGSSVEGWRITQGAGQQIHMDGIDSTSGAGGYIESAGRYNSICLICVVANTDWAYHSGFGNYNVE